MAEMIGKRQSGASTLELKRTEAVPESMRDGIREITNLYTPEEKRRKGDARMLMYQVCYEADKKGMVLLLEANAVGGLPQNKLVKFYEGFGFIKLQQKPLLMARQAHGG